MTMQEIPKDESRLERIEQKADQILDRLTRMEERQNSHAGQLESHTQQIADHSQRIRKIELAHAVASATTQQQGKQLMGRWAAVGAVALVVLGAIGTFIGNAIVEIMSGGAP